MALKGKWKDKVNGVDMNNADDINQVAHAVMELEEKESGGISQETDPTVPSWAKQPKKPTYTASEVGALPSSTKIPTTTNELTNNSGFITKAVSDLTNYYTKSQTYTQDEVRALISAIPKFSISVVSSLPTANISTTTIYLVGGGTGSDLYTEYIYANGKWEILGAQRVDLTGYAKETWVNTQLSSYLKSTDLNAAINAALAQARESGEFDGEDGRGIKSIARTSGTGAAGTTDTYTITYTDNTTSTFTVYNGKNGTNGKDYVLTDADRAEMVAMVLEAIGGNPIYGYIDENNHIVLSGNMPDGTYTASYEDENGSIVSLVGQLVKDTNVYYSVTSNLTNCTNSNSTKTVVQGGSYSATISANSGYELKSVVVTMGGSPVSVSGGVINIASVTGDIVITAVAEEIVVEIVNQIPLSKDENGNPYNGGQGWKTGYRLSGSSGAESALAGIEVTGYIPVKYGDTIRIKGITDDGTHVMGFYDTNHAKIVTLTSSVAWTTLNGALVQRTIGLGNLVGTGMENVAYMRISANEITNNSIITINQSIE